MNFVIMLQGWFLLNSIRAWIRVYFPMCAGQDARVSSVWFLWRFFCRLPRGWLKAQCIRPFSQGFSGFKFAQVHWDLPVPKLKGNCQKERKQIKITIWQISRKTCLLRFSTLRLTLGLLRMQLGLHPSFWARASFECSLDYILRLGTLAPSM